MGKRNQSLGGYRAISVHDVAARAGVSPITVSRAFRQPGKVAEATRERITAAADQLGYLPNRLAGQLSSNRSNVAGVILPSLRNSIFADTIQALSDVLTEHGYRLMVADSGHGLDDEEALIYAMLENRVSGLVLHNTLHTRRAREMIGRARIPVVETGDLTPTPLDSTVGYSNFTAARAMTGHLLRLGYRGIGFVGLPTRNNERARARQEGYAAALADHSITFDPRLVLETPGGVASGAEAVNRMRRIDPEPQAVFFAADVLAVGALFECQRRGWRVPGDVAIASFDDVEALEYTVPSLTSLRIPRYAIGRRAGEVVLDRVHGRSDESVSIDLGFEIVQRESA